MQGNLKMQTPVIQNEFFSHGTIECTNMEATRDFLCNFLGLNMIRPMKQSQYMWKGGPWSVVCVHVEDGECKDQLIENRFVLAVANTGEVDASHACAVALKAQYGIKEIRPPETLNGVRSFKLKDHNNTWWEISSASLAYFDSIFTKGDAVH